MAEIRDTMTREEADEVAGLIGMIARKEAKAWVEEQQGAQWQYVWGIADPAATPAPNWTHEVSEPLEPIDFTVTFHPDYPASGASVPLVYSLNSGSSWSAYGSAASVSGVVGHGSVASAPDLPAVALLALGSYSGGGGLYMAVKVRFRRTGQHVGARRA
jgi:hypothetical protein